MSVKLMQGESVNLTTGVVSTPEDDYTERYTPEYSRDYYRAELQANNLAAVPSAIYLFGEH